MTDLYSISFISLVFTPLPLGFPGFPPSRSHLSLPDFNLCGIDKPIFSHVARHTYATRCLNRGIRLEVVAKLLGHSTTRITQHYAKLLQNNILNEVKDAFEKSY